jgi:hypothetical protein
MMKALFYKPIIPAAVMVWLLFALVTAAQEPVTLPGYNVYKNNWSEVCDYSGHTPPVTGDFIPLNGEFSPNDFYSPLLIYPFGLTEQYGASGVPDEVSGWWSTSLPPQLGTTYQPTNYYDFTAAEGGSAIRIDTQCYWRPRFLSRLVPDNLDELSTPEESFLTRQVRFADVGFMYKTETIAYYGYLMSIKYRFNVTWEKDGTGITTETNISGSITGVQSGHVLESVPPKEGYRIIGIKLVFERGYVPFDLIELIPPLEINVDRIVFTGYEPLYNPTPTAAAPTRTPVAITPTQTPTPRPGLWGTPTPAATTTGTPQAVATFPRQYSSVPTAIPALAWPTWPAAPKLTPIATPLPLILAPLLPITPTWPALPTPVALITAAPLEYTLNTLPTGQPTPTPQAITQQVISWTNWLSSTAANQATTPFTVANAPAEYAASLPRPLANVGYTFEQMRSGTETGQAYNVHAWAALLGYIASIPVQFVKSLMQLADILGPFGLFLTWLLVMFPFVLGVKVFIFIKNLIINLVNLAIKLVKFIGDIWDLIPGL